MTIFRLGSVGTSSASCVSFKTGKFNERFQHEEQRLEWVRLVNDGAARHRGMIGRIDDYLICEFGTNDRGVVFKELFAATPIASGEPLGWLSTHVTRHF